MFTHIFGLVSIVQLLPFISIDVVSILHHKLRSFSNAGKALQKFSFKNLTKFIKSNLSNLRVNEKYILLRPTYRDLR